MSNTLIKLKDNRDYVLLIYPSLYKITGLPIGISMLSAVLREKGYEVQIFDTALFDVLRREDGETLRAERLSSKKIPESDILEQTNEDVCKAMLDKLGRRKPLFVGVSSEESNFGIACKLAECLKAVMPDVLVIAGGVFPSLAPEVVLDAKCFDYVCIGEGETTVVEIAQRLSKGLRINDVCGLVWKRSDDTIVTNTPSKMHDISKLPFPDFSGFGEHLFFKPMQGQLYKMINITSSRGCPYACTYCAAPSMKKFASDNKLGQYFRLMPMSRVVEQIHHQIKLYSPEFLYFSSETFLAICDEQFEIFVKEYSKIGLPFWFQTRIETINESRIKALKDVGLYWMTIGIEHGNESFRKKVLGRSYSNKSALQAAEVLAKLGVGASLNNMMGFPEETRELIFDTINLNRLMRNINPKFEFNVWMFTPFMGCELYRKCLERGIIRGVAPLANTEFELQSVLDFPMEFKESLKGLMKTFNLYVRLPESRFAEIRDAELDNEKGLAAFMRLSELVESKY